jgi:hypothetical protein
MRPLASASRARLVVGLVCAGAAALPIVAHAAGGLAAKRPEEIARASIQATSKVRRIQISGWQVDRDGRTSMRMQLAVPGRLRAHLEQGGGLALDFVVIRSKVYLRANARYWAKEGHLTAQQAAVFADRWLTMPASTLGTLDELRPFMSVRAFQRCVLQSDDDGTLRKLGTGRVGTTPVVVLEAKGDRPGTSPGRVYVAAQGPPLVVREVQTGRERSGGKPDRACGDDGKPDTTRAGDLRIAYDDAIDVTAPANAIDLSALLRKGSGTPKTL